MGSPKQSGRFVLPSFTTPPSVGILRRGELRLTLAQGRGSMCDGVDGVHFVVNYFSCFSFYQKRIIYFFNCVLWILLFGGYTYLTKIHISIKLMFHISLLFSFCFTFRETIANWDQNFFGKYLLCTKSNRTLSKSSSKWVLSPHLNLSIYYRTVIPGVTVPTLAMANRRWQPRLTA